MCTLRLRETERLAADSTLHRLCGDDGLLAAARADRLERRGGDSAVDALLLCGALWLCVSRLWAGSKGATQAKAA